MMLQGKHRSSGGSYDAQALTNDAYEYAKPMLNIHHDQVHPDPKKVILHAKMFKLNDIYLVETWILQGATSLFCMMGSLEAGANEEILF